MSSLRRLVYLYMWAVPLSNSALSSLCIGLIHHPTIRCIVLDECDLNSNSCEILTHLIPTVPQLKKLEISNNILSEPDPNPIKLLEQTAELYSLTLETKSLFD